MHRSDWLAACSAPASVPALRPTRDIAAPDRRNCGSPLAEAGKKFALCQKKSSQIKAV
jgi:hypothetical protein